VKALKLPKHVRICGVIIPVRVGTSKDCAGLDGAYACYDRDKLIIWVDASTPAPSRQFWTSHEALHALLGLSGLLEVTKAAFGLKDDDARLEAWEEAVVRVLTPNIVDVFGPLRGVR